MNECRLWVYEPRRSKIGSYKEIVGECKYIGVQFQIQFQIVSKCSINLWYMLYIKVKCQISMHWLTFNNLFKFSSVYYVTTPYQIKYSIKHWWQEAPHFVFHKNYKRENINSCKAIILKSKLHDQFSCWYVRTSVFIYCLILVLTICLLVKHDVTL